MITLLAVLALAIWWFWPVRQPQVIAPPGQEQLKRLEVQNDSLLAINRELGDQLRQLQNQADSLQNLIWQDQKIITQLKTQQHEEIRTIALYDHHELFDLFAKYPLKTSDTTR